MLSRWSDSANVLLNLPYFVLNLIQQIGGDELADRFPLPCLLMHAWVTVCARSGGNKPWIKCKTSAPGAPSSAGAPSRAGSPLLPTKTTSAGPSKTWTRISSSPRTTARPAARIRASKGRRRSRRTLTASSVRLNPSGRRAPRDRRRRRDSTVARSGQASLSRPDDILVTILVTRDAESQPGGSLVTS